MGTRNATKVKTYRAVKSAAAQAKLADEWFALRAKRLAEKAIMDKTEAQERAAKHALIESMVKYQVGAIGGATVTVTHEVEDKPTVEDWDAVWEWAVENEAPDLFQRRLNEAAVKARWDDEVDIPGVTTYPVDKLSYTTVKR